MSVLQQVDDWEPGTVTVAVVDPDGVVAAHGDTGADLRWASVTKPVFAYAVLTLIDERVVHLDEPAGPPGATVRHLLAHASGLPGLGGGATVDPGRRRIYSNEGFDALGEFVGERTGASPTELLWERVLAPLGMTATALGGRSPAEGLVGPLRDLAAFAHELLAPTLVPHDLLVEATRTTQFPGLAGVLPGFGRQADNAWGLGFEIRSNKHPHWTGPTQSPATFGHFGGSGSFLWVDPEARLACVELADRDFDDWPAAERWPPFNDAVLAAYGPSA